MTEAKNTINLELSMVDALAIVQGNFSPESSSVQNGRAQAGDPYKFVKVKREFANNPAFIAALEAQGVTKFGGEQGPQA